MILVFASVCRHGGARVFLLRKIVWDVEFSFVSVSVSDSDSDCE